MFSSGEEEDVAKDQVEEGLAMWRNLDQGKGGKRTNVV